MKEIESKLITFDDNDASDIVLLETEMLDFLDSFVNNENNPRDYITLFDKCISMQSTKTPLYSIMIALLAKNHRSFVEECVQLLVTNFYSELERGCYIECTLRLRCLCILSLFNIISHESLLSFYQNMISKIKETHNATLIRSVYSSLLYIYRYIAMHEAPLTPEEYASLCSSLHSYFETEYTASSTYKNQSSGYLLHIYKENDLFFAYDQALSNISSLIQHINDDPSIRPRVLSLDFSYCTIVRTVFEEFRSVYQSGEILLAKEKPSLRDRIRLLCCPQPLNLVIADSLAEKQLTDHPIPHLYYNLVSVDDGLTFTLLPTYQSLVLADFVEHIFTLFKPSWKSASQFIQLLKKLVTSVYEIDTRTLHNNLAFITCQTLFAFLMDTTLDGSFSQQAASTLIDLSIHSINSNQGEQASFIERISPALFKFIDTIANKADILTFQATKKVIQFFALYMSNTNYFWPWNKWETVNKLSPTSCYRIFISELIIACCSLSGYQMLASTVPPSILKLTEIGCFTPTQPIRDQDPKLRENIELLIQSKAIKMIKKHIEEQYNNRGPFVSELTILLDFCLQPKETRQILSNFREYKEIFMLVKLDKEIMILEEIFSRCHHHPKVTAMILKELLDLSIVSIDDFFRFLRITRTNYALFYYWDIVDHVLTNVQDSHVFEELLKVIVAIGSTTTQEKHSGYILNILEQMGRKYKAEFLRKGGVSEEFTREIKSYDVSNGVIIRFLRV